MSIQFCINDMFQKDTTATRNEKLNDRHKLLPVVSLKTFDGSSFVGSSVNQL